MKIDRALHFVIICSITLPTSVQLMIVFLELFRNCQQVSVTRYPRSCDQIEQRLICHYHLPDVDDFPDTVKTLELHHIERDVINMNTILKQFPSIENISIDSGSISRFISPKTTNNIRVLLLRNINVESIESSFVNKYPNLETLDLRGNNLQNLKTNFSFGKLQNVYLSGNKWNCSMDLSWVFNLNRTVIKDFDNLTCFEEPHAGKELPVIAGFMKDIKEQCPPICYCTLPKVVRVPESDRLEPLVEVNCSHRGLTELPDNLPSKTRILKLENNEIEDLRPLKENKIYQKILDLYLDNNKIKSIEELEGSYWLRHFRVFSLSGNKLTELPTYALDNALEQNTNMPNAVRITLGGNTWRCDCVFTPVFQDMLQKFASQIKDIPEIKCSYVEGDENSLLPIIELSRSSVCRSPSEYSVEALDLLNGVLASLIILILGKLAYDYYYFKKTGRLPWIVTKMP